MIDRQTGNLLFAPSVYVCGGDSLETVAALGLGESTEVRDMQTGWQWLIARNVQVGSEYFALAFGFRDNRLQRVSLAVSSERVEAVNTWETLSERAERQQLEKLRQWIRREVGRDGAFSWGSVTAQYDFKNATSGITIAYNPTST